MVRVRKKKTEKIELKPFCFYCDREFDDEPTLVQHQKARHFKYVSLSIRWSSFRALFDPYRAERNKNILPLTFYPIFSLRCDVCHKKMATGHALRVHCVQVRANSRLLPIEFLRKPPIHARYS